MNPSLLMVAVPVVAGTVGLDLGPSTPITEVLAGLLRGPAQEVSRMPRLDVLTHFGPLGLVLMAGFEVAPPSSDTNGAPVSASGDCRPRVSVGSWGRAVGRALRASDE
jgi:hypothetical protein